MAEKIDINPTPIQSNTNDVAFELTKLYSSTFGFTSKDEIEKSYAKYYALARTLETNGRYLNDLVPENILNKIK